MGDTTSEEPVPLPKVLEGEANSGSRIITGVTPSDRKESSNSRVIPSLLESLSSRSMLEEMREAEFKLLVEDFILSRNRDFLVRPTELLELLSEKLQFEGLPNSLDLLKKKQMEINSVIAELCQKGSLIPALEQVQHPSSESNRPRRCSSGAERLLDYFKKLMATKSSEPCNASCFMLPLLAKEVFIRFKVWIKDRENQPKNLRKTDLQDEYVIEAETLFDFLSEQVEGNITDLHLKNFVWFMNRERVTARHFSITINDIDTSTAYKISFDKEAKVHCKDEEALLDHWVIKEVQKRIDAFQKRSIKYKQQAIMCHTEANQKSFWKASTTFRKKAEHLAELLEQVKNTRLDFERARIFSLVFESITAATALEESTSRIEESLCIEDENEFREFERELTEMTSEIFGSHRDLKAFRVYKALERNISSTGREELTSFGGTSNNVNGRRKRFALHNPLCNFLPKNFQSMKRAGALSPSNNRSHSKESVKTFGVCSSFKNGAAIPNHLKKPARTALAFRKFHHKSARA